MFSIGSVPVLYEGQTHANKITCEKRKKEKETKEITIAKSRD
jgi:hypothetical protein